MSSLAEDLFRIVKDVSIPRRTGSDGEKEVREYILTFLKERQSSASSENEVKDEEAPEEKSAADESDEKADDEAEKETDAGDDKTDEKDDGEEEEEEEEEEAETSDESDDDKSSIKVLTQPFSISSDTARVIYGVFALSFIMLLFLNVFLLIFVPRPPTIYLGILTSLLIIFALTWGTRWSSIIEGLSRRKSADKDMLKTENIIARIDRGAMKTVVFSAHYDSKSGTAPFNLRFLLGGFAYGGSFIVALYTLWETWFVMSNVNRLVFLLPQILKYNLAMAIVSTIIICILAVFYYLGAGNKSPGAIDNATGVAVLLKLAEHYKNNPPENLNLWFVATAAEEEGMAGMVRFLDEYEHGLDKGYTYFVNMDGVGGKGMLDVVTSYGLPPVKTAEDLGDRVVEAARLEEVDARTRWAPPGVGFDSIPPAHRWFQSVDLSFGGMDKTLKAIHTEGDVPENVTPESLEKTFRVCKRTADLIGKS